jgi:hypothetical protein
MRKCPCGRMHYAKGLCKPCYMKKLKQIKKLEGR